MVSIPIIIMFCPIFYHSEVQGRSAYLVQLNLEVKLTAFSVFTEAVS